LQQTGWIRKRAAQLLAISYRSLLYKIQRYKITQPGAAGPEKQGIAAEPAGKGSGRKVA